MGKYEFDRAKLKHHSTLSVRYGSTKKKVNGFPNAPVSNAVREHLFHLTTGEGLPQKLNGAEEHMIHHLVSKSEANIQLKPVGIPSTKPAPKPLTLLYTMVAEVEAGNDSQELKQRIDQMLNRLQQQGHISSTFAHKIRSHYL
jgi:hypothetical protein